MSDELRIEKVSNVEMIFDCLCNDGRLHKLEMTFNGIEDSVIEMIDDNGTKKIKLEFEYKDKTFVVQD